MILQGDCRERMAEMEENSIDAIVCDPPYELGFMGKKWDGSGIAYDQEVWRQAWLSAGVRGQQNGTQTGMCHRGCRI